MATSRSDTDTRTCDCSECALERVSHYRDSGKRAARPYQPGPQQASYTKETHVVRQGN